LRRHPQKGSNPKLPNVLKIETTRFSASLKGLNSSLAQPAAELWPYMLATVGASIVADAGLKEGRSLRFPPLFLQAFIVSPVFRFLNCNGSPGCMDRQL